MHFWILQLPCGTWKEYRNELVWSSLIDCLFLWFLIFFFLSSDIKPNILVPISCCFASMHQTVFHVEKYTVSWWTAGKYAAECTNWNQNAFCNFGWLDLQSSHPNPLGIEIYLMWSVKLSFSARKMIHFQRRCDIFKNIHLMVDFPWDWSWWNFLLPALDQTEGITQLAHEDCPRWEGLLPTTKAKSKICCWG